MYRVGIIGLGRIAWKLESDPKRKHPATHAGAIVANPNLDLVTGCNRSFEGANAFKEEYGLKKVYTDYKEMIKNEKLDIVAVTTNPETHAEIVVDIANMGIKGIVCEKPMSLALDESKRMIDACRNNGTKLIVMHNRRFNSIYRTARKLIDDGVIGKVNTVVGICQGCKPGKNWQSTFEGPLLHDATHLFDILRYLLGDVKWVLSDVERTDLSQNVEDSANSLLHFENGVVATTFVNERTDYMRFEIEIQGSLGKMSLKTNEARLWTIKPSKYVSNFNELEEVEFPVPGTELNSYEEVYKEIIHLIENGVESELVSGVDGYKALEIIMAIYESKINGITPVKLPLTPNSSSLVRGIEIGAF